MIYISTCINIHLILPLVVYAHVLKKQKWKLKFLDGKLGLYYMNFLVLPDLLIISFIDETFLSNNLKS